MENQKKFHGFLGLPRHAKLLLHDLDNRLFGFYVGLVMEATWYRGNRNFGSINKSQKELSEVFDCKQPKISRLLDSLQRKKYIIRHRNKVILKYFPLFLNDVAMKIHSNDYSDLHSLYSDVYKINAELHEKYSIVQEKRAQKHSQRLNSSSNGNSNSFKDELDLTQE